MLSEFYHKHVVTFPTKEVLGKFHRSGHCFLVVVAGKDMTGPNVPKIEFGLPGKTGEVTWGFYGANTMVKVSEMVMCLAFYDGGMNPNDWIVIGTHQLQEYLLEFDLSTSTFAFSDSLLLHSTTCSSISPS